METGEKATAILGAPAGPEYTDYFNFENLDQELRKIADATLYEFLSSESFSPGVYYFEWMQDNVFRLMEEKPKWAEL